MKTADLIGPALDWAVANPGKVNRYMPLIERIHRQSHPMRSGCREWIGKLNEHGYGMCKHQGQEGRAHRHLFFACSGSTS